MSNKLFSTIRRLTCRHEWRFSSYLHGHAIIAHNYKRFEYICIKCGIYNWFERPINCYNCKHLWYNNSGQAECLMEPLDKACIKFGRCYWEENCSRMVRCKYSEYCMCQTCEFQSNNSSKECCNSCNDCEREKRQVHDVWSCTKYERSKYLRLGSKNNSNEV